ncbi:MAG: hypothetical protein RIE58_04045 [Vicingaceae bacterium]
MQRLTLIFLLSSASLFAQTGKVLDARNNLANNDLKNAKILIDQASEEPEFQNDFHFWYWKGYIYKELYKVQDKGNNPQSLLRHESMTAFIKVLSMQNNVPQDTLESTMKLINYFASTYYNDAVVSLNEVNYGIAIENYDKFRKAAKIVYPDVELSDKDIKFKMKLATIYVSLYEKNPNTAEGDRYFEKAKQEYAEIIRMDNSNLTANYNLGIHFYNKAVNIIKNLDVGTSLEDLAKQEDICVDLFLQALPYVKTAYELDPNRKETLIGLTGIYWSLNDLEKYEFYQEKLKALE